MQYGQLPWLALRNVARNSIRQGSNSAARLYTTPSQRQLSSIATSRLPRPFLATTSFSSKFSTSPARRKDSNEPKDPVTEEITEEAEKKKGAKTEVSGDDVVETIKAKASESAPQSAASKTAVDGKGSKSSAGAAGGSGDAGSGDGSKKSKKPMAIAKPTVPDVYPQVLAIPCDKRPLFPGFYKAVTIRDPNVVAAVQDMIKRGQPYIGAFLFKDETLSGDTIESLDDVHSVGVFAQITSAFPVNGDEKALTIVLYPHRRIKMTSLILPEKEAESKSAAVPVEPEAIPEPIPSKTKENTVEENKGDVVASFEETTTQTGETSSTYEPASFLRNHKVSVVNVENVPEEPYDVKSPLTRALTNEIVNVFKEVANLNPLFRDQISTFSMSQSAGNVMQEPAKLADFAAAVSAGETLELQDVLETNNVEERLQKALTVLKKELMNAQLQLKISKDVESKIQKRQREYWLLEQMKGIKAELGIESDGKDKLVEKFKEKAAKLAMPEAVQKVFEEEINKLAHLEPEIGRAHV